MPSSAVWPTTAVFQSMLSNRRATSMRIDWCTESGFQSTLSKRRAMHLRFLLERHPTISIHALQAESDVLLVFDVPNNQYFNPRSPSGERLSIFHPCFCVTVISIHALQAESDFLTI